MAVTATDLHSRSLKTLPKGPLWLLADERPEMIPAVIPVLMCGGAGTRLWPVSRESMPKQFVPLVGDRSTFQQTLQRVADATLFGRPIVITNTDFRFVSAQPLREPGIEADS